MLERVKVADIVSALGVPAPKRGNSTRCPIHKGNNLTLSINEQKGGWQFFACGQHLFKWREDVIDLLRAYRECIRIVHHIAIKLGKSEHESLLWEKIRELDLKIEWRSKAPSGLLNDVYQQMVDGTVTP